MNVNYNEYSSKNKTATTYFIKSFKVNICSVFPADIHYEATLIHNGKELHIPICGAMSTIMTDDINQCTCKCCIGRFLTKLYDLKISMQQKDEGERENE